MNLCYRFPVVKGKQAGRDYYIGMVPLNMLCKIFDGDEEYVLPEYRAQRRLNESRIPDIKNYILDNKDTYVFSALTASIDGKCNYVPSDIEDAGTLEVSLDARFLINDGQHRKAAILAAIEEDGSIGDETISIVFFADKGLSRSQQMFTDLNKHAVKTSNSISELYDSRDRLAVETRKMVSNIQFFDDYVDKEKDNLGKYSSALFTLNNIYSSNKRILKRKKCDSEFSSFINEYWQYIVDYMVPWNELVNKEISKIELREKYIASQSIVLQAFGRVGCYLFENNVKDLKDILEPIQDINWKRSSATWRGRVIRKDGRLSTGNDAITLIANTIKKNIGIELSDDEMYLEKKYSG